MDPMIAEFVKILESGKLSRCEVRAVFLGLKVSMKANGIPKGQWYFRLEEAYGRI